MSVINKNTVVCRFLATTMIVSTLFTGGQHVDAATFTPASVIENVVAPKSVVRQFVSYSEDVTFKRGEFIPRYRTVTRKINGRTYSGTLEAISYAGKFAEKTITVTYEGKLYL